MSTGRKRKQSIKKQDEDDETHPSVKKLKGCERRLCQEIYCDPPSCFCKASDK